MARKTRVKSYRRRSGVVVGTHYRTGGSTYSAEVEAIARRILARSRDIETRELSDREDAYRESEQAEDGERLAHLVLYGTRKQ